MAGTKIATPNGNKNIEEIVVGDTVMSFNEQTKKIESTKVIETFFHTANEYLLINGKLKVTPNHLIFINGKWQEIGTAKTGDKIKTSAGEEIIASIKKRNEPQSVYNIEVEKNHNYYADGYLVHNKLRLPNA